MRDYKRKRIGYGNLYIAIDKVNGLARVGYSTNLYTTQANLAKNWSMLVSYESENAGLLDQRISKMLASERAVSYQSSKSYKLDSYRVRKLIKSLQIEIDYPVSMDHDVCPCLHCGNDMEIEYRSNINLLTLLEIWEQKRYCNDCECRSCVICDKTISTDRITCGIKCEILYRKNQLWELGKRDKKDVPRKVWRK